jgi:hypothetical protein
MTTDPNLDTSKAATVSASRDGEELKEMSFLNESVDDLSDDEPSDDGDMDPIGNTGSDAGTKNDSSQGGSGDDEDKMEFTPEMTRSIFRLRVAVVLVLIASGVLTFVVYSIIKSSETEGFELSYEGASSKVLEAFQGIVTEKFQAVTSLAIAATAHAIDHVDKWPMSTLSWFQDRAGAARRQSGALFAGLVPLVTFEQRDAYENYTARDPKGWIQEGLDTQAHWDPLVLGINLPTAVEKVHPGYIVGDDWELGLVRDEGYGPYFPIWQASPILNDVVNFNLGSIPLWMEEIKTTTRDRALIVGRTITPPLGKSRCPPKLLLCPPPYYIQILTGLIACINIDNIR